MPRVDQDWMLNDQYARVRQLERRLSKGIADGAPGDDGPVDEAVLGRSDGAAGRLLGLKSVSQIFSYWDKHFFQNVMDRGRRDGARKQYFYPWWTHGEDATQTSFGSMLTTNLIGFGMNATFETLCRLMFTSLTMGEQVRRQASTSASMQAWRSSFTEKMEASTRSLEERISQLAPVRDGLAELEQTTATSLRALSARVQRQEEQLSAQREETERARREVWEKVGDEVRTLRRDQSDVLMRHIEEWVMKGAAQENFSVLAERLDDITLSLARLEQDTKGRMTRIEKTLDGLEARLDWARRSGGLIEAVPHALEGPQRPPLSKRGPEPESPRRL